MVVGQLSGGVLSRCREVKRTQRLTFVPAESGFTIFANTLRSEYEQVTHGVK